MCCLLFSVPLFVGICCLTLRVVRCSFFVVPCCFLFDVCCCLIVGCCVLLVACWLLSLVDCLLFVRSSLSSFVVCCGSLLQF